MASLTLEKVNKVYHIKRSDDVHAVKDLSLTADSGQVIALLGSSGCGKTSTLRMIAGFETITEGSISIGERRINHLRPAQRRVAMAFEGYALYPPLSVFDNIAFALSRSGFSRNDIRQRVRDIAETLEITDILDRKPLGLSGGQQQRVSLARALLRSPELYLLDEPMSQLEPQLRALLRSRVKEYLLHQQITTVFVTHDQTEAMALADRVAVMEGGVLQQYGTPYDLENRPSNLFVGSFIGEPPMNVLHAKVASADNNIHLQVAGESSEALFDVILPQSWVTADMRQALTEGRTLYLGIRAHRVVFAGDKDTDDAIDVDVLSNQWLGDQSHLALQAAGHRLIAVSDGALDQRAGGGARIRLPKENLHIFDGESTTALFHGQDSHEQADRRSVVAA